MKRDVLHDGTTSQSLVLKLRNGDLLTVPRKEIGRDDQGPILVPEWSAIPACSRCETHPRDDGTVSAIAGLIRAFRIIDTTWHPFVAACDCPFGSFRRLPTRKDDRRLPGYPYMDDLGYVPPGLSTRDWTWLHIVRGHGDGLAAAAQKLPEGYNRREFVIDTIRQWEQRPVPNAKRHQALNPDDNGDPL